jgi:hypothetical protein
LDRWRKPGWGPLEDDGCERRDRYRERYLQLLGERERPVSLGGGGKERRGNKYIKTQNDGDQPNNLLSLPECP